MSDWRELTADEVRFGEKPVTVRCVDCKGKDMFHKATCRDTSRYEVPPEGAAMEARLIQELPALSGKLDFTERLKAITMADDFQHEIHDATFVIVERERQLRAALAESAALHETIATLRAENIKLLNDASVWRNRAIGAEEELREGGRGIDLRRGFER